MKKKVTKDWRSPLKIGVLSLLLLFFCSSNLFAQYTDGNLTVFKVTNGAALANTGTAIIAEEYLPATATQAAPNYSVALPTTGANKVVVSGTAGSAGAISRSENGRYILVPGYNGLVGDANSTFTTNGTVRTIDGGGNVGAGMQASVLWFSASNNLRGATSDDGTNYWMSGGTTGIQWAVPGTPGTVTTISTTSNNTRYINIFNGQLFFSTGAGTNGIYKVGNGKPTTTGTTSTNQALSTAPYGFSVSPDGLTIYAFSSANQIVRFTYSGTYNPATFTYSGGAWSAASTGFTLTGATGLAVDWNNYSYSTGANGAKIYACNPTTLVTGNDNGTGAITTTTLRTISGNNAFRGLAFSPVKQTVSLGANTPATGVLTAGATDVVLFQFNLSANEGNSTIKKLILKQNGTLTLGADISTFRLIADANNNGIYDGGETVLAGGSISGTDITFSGIAQGAIAQGGNNNYLVVGNMAASPSSGTFIPSIVANKTLNSVNYTTNLFNGGGGYVNIGVTAPTGNTLTYTAPTPVISVSSPSFTGFDYIFGFGPSTEQSFTFTGAALTGAPDIITVSAAGSAYEVSTDNINYFTSVTYNFVSSSLSAQTVYVRLKASQAVASYNGQIINLSGGGASNTVTVSGTVSPQIPLITVSALTPTNIFTTNNPTPSAVSTFTVTGQFLTDPLTVSALAGYEYSDNGGFSWSSSLSYNTATVNKTIQVRLIGTPAGTYNGTISIESLTAVNSPSTISVTGTVILVPLLTEVILPQYMKGNSNSSRLPYVFRATINNLNPNATYRFFNQCVISSDGASVNGAGNPIFMNTPTWVHCNSTSLSTAGGYGEFDTDGSGSYTGWFAVIGTGNAKFNTGTDVFMRIMLNDGAGGTTVVNRVTTTNTVKCLDLINSAGANNATAVRSVSNALAKDFVFLWNNDLGTGRPLSGTYFESDGVTNASASTFYSLNVDGVNKAWGTLVPNNNVNGIRFISSYSRTNGGQLCTYSDADGVWPTGSINTVNPIGGNTTPIVLSNVDVPLQCFLLPYANITANLTSGTEAASTVVTLTATLTGTIASSQTIDLAVSGLNIAGTDYTLSASTLTFAAGTNPTATATFTVFNDVLYEGIETATITISNPSAGIELGFSTSVDIDIIDNEVPKIVINEIMYNSLGADEEWVELYNNDIVNVTVDETWSITGTPSSGGPWTRLFPLGTLITLAPGQYITVQLGSAGAFPFVPSIVLSSTADQLSNTGAPLILKINGATIDNVTYSPVTFTPAANGSGPSLSLNNPSFDNSLPASWGACKISGTPNLLNFNCDASIYYSILSGDLNPEAFNSSTAIWSTTPNGTIGLCPSFTSTRNLVIQNGTTVRLNYLSTAPSINNLTVNVGGKLYTNINTSGSELYIRLFGNINNSGVIGNGVTYDAIGLSIEGINSTLSGTGSYNLGRIRKDLVTNATSAVTINANVNLRYPGAAFYNNIAGSTINLNVNAGRYLTLTDPTGDLSIDGVDGTGSGDRRGNITVNGILNIADKLFALTNNTSAATCSMTINSTGRVIVNNIDANISGNGGAVGAFPITINSGAVVSINQKLKVIAGDLNSNGGIVLKSTPTQTALIDGSGAGNVTGDVLVERKIGTLSGYHFLSSPVQGAFVNNSVSGWRDDFTILTSVDNIQFIPGSTYSVLPTVFEYDETNLNPNSAYGFIGATGTTDPITPLKGFACVVPANTVVDVFGVVNNGPVNYSVTKASDGINLIGNPYPSPINWTTFQSHNTNLETIYKAFKTTGGYAGNYGEYNSFTNLGTNGVGNIIASSQAFMVTATTAGAIQALNTDRTTDLNPTYFSQPAIVNDVLRLELIKDAAHDEIIIFYAPSVSTDNFDALTDAKKLLPINTDHSFVYSLAGNDKLAMNGLGAFNMDKVIPLGIEVSVSGSHQIVATDLSSFAPGAMVYLYDAATGTVQNLRSNPSYFVNLTAGTHEGRFFIQFTPAVQFTTINTTCAGNGNDGQLILTYNSSALINVSVQNELGDVIATINNFNGQQTINNLLSGNYQVTYTHPDGYTSVDYFTISNVTPVNLQAYASNTNSVIGENIHFNAISTSGITSWNFGDGVSVTGNDVNHIYNAEGNYIVTATGSNGVCEQIIEIPVSVTSATGIENMDNQSTTWLITNNQITVKFSEGISENTSIELFDLAGKLVYSNTISKGQTQHNIPTAKFAEGIYVAKLNLNESILVKKVALRK